MVDPNSLPSMPIEQLPDVGRMLFDVADIAARKPVKRSFEISDIYTLEPRGQIVPINQSSDPQLNFLKILWKLADIPSYVSGVKEVTRANVGTVAHLGGFAVVQLCETAMDKLTPQAFGLVYPRLIHIQAGLEEAHRTTIRNTGADRRVSKLLVDTRRALRPETAWDMRPPSAQAE